MLRPMWESFLLFPRPIVPYASIYEPKQGASGSQGWRRDNKKSKKGIDLVWVGRNVYLWDPSFICTR